MDIEGREDTEVFVCLNYINSCERLKDEKMEIEGGADAEVFACLKPVNSCEISKEGQMEIELGVDAEVFLCFICFFLIFFFVEHARSL